MSIRYSGKVFIERLPSNDMLDKQIDRQEDDLASLLLVVPNKESRLKIKQAILKHTQTRCNIR
jgi:hypothetical protein